MTSKWNSATIGDTCEILDNLRKPVTKSDRVQGQIPYYGASGILDYVKDYIFDEKLVLLGEDGAKWGPGDRSAFIIEGKAWVNNHAHVLRPNREILLDEWLTYFLIGSDLSDYISGVTVPKLNQGKMREIQFPLPPLDEQKRIVAKLDEALGDLDRLTENSKRTLDQIDALWVASIDEVMNEISSGTQMSTIGDIFKTSSGGTPLKSRKDYYEGGSVPWLLSGEVANSEITSAKNFITELALKETSAKLAPSDSVLVAMYGATAGEVGILRFEASTNQAVCAIHPIEGWNTEFIYYWMVYSKNHLISMAAGNAQPNVSQIKIRSLPIPLLDQRSQDNVVSRLSEIKKSQEETYLLKRQSMSEQNLLRGSILSAAFAGDF